MYIARIKYFVKVLPPPVDTPVVSNQMHQQFCSHCGMLWLACILHMSCQMLVESLEGAMLSATVTSENQLRATML